MNSPGPSDPPPLEHPTVDHPALDGPALDELAETAVDLAVQLVRIDTVNPALVPGAPGEAAAVAFLADRLAARGLRVEIIEADGVPGRPSLLATAAGTGGAPSVMLNGHLDTVGTASIPDPWSGRIEGDRRTGRLHGRGSCDMKGGVAAMVAAAEHVVATGPQRGDVVLSLVADEEHASIGVEAVIRHLARDGRLPARCLVAEPTWLDLVVAHRGFDVLEVRLRGRAAHSSQPERGVDAVRHLGRVLAEVERYDLALASVEAHPLGGHGSLRATVVSGGTAPFTIADHASVVIELRTLPGEPSGTGSHEVRRILDHLAAGDPTFDASATELLSRPAWEAGDDDATAAMLASLSAAFVDAGRQPRLAGAPYWMESALWAAAGVPTVVCGPAGGGMHADDEWLDLAQLRDFTVAVRGLIVDTVG